jgi:hypothetical protein
VLGVVVPVHQPTRSPCNRSGPSGAKLLSTVSKIENGIVESHL